MDKRQNLTPEDAAAEGFWSMEDSMAFSGLSYDELLELVNAKAIKSFRAGRGRGGAHRISVVSLTRYCAKRLEERDGEAA